MRSLFVLTSCFIALSVIALAQPKIEVIGGDSYDWGKIPAPKEGHLEATIKIKNVGTELLKLIEIKPGCGCTKTDPDKTELKPGEVSTMGVKLNISPMQSGPLIKNITVRSNTPGPDSTKYLFLKADIVRKAQLSQMYFAFVNPFVGKEMTATVDVLNNDTKDLVVSDFQVDNDMKLNVSGTKTIKPGEKLELKLVAIPKVKGSFNGQVKFKTSSEENPEFIISAYAVVQDNP